MIDINLGEGIQSGLDFLSESNRHILGSILGEILVLAVVALLGAKLYFDHRKSEKDKEITQTLIREGGDRRAGNGATKEDLQELRRAMMKALGEHDKENKKDFAALIKAITDMGKEFIQDIGKVRESVAKIEGRMEGQGTKPKE